MRVLRNILLICSVVGGLSVAAMAQKDGDKKPKPPPPVVNPAPPKPKPDNTPKKPHGAEASIVWMRPEELV